MYEQRFFRSACNDYMPRSRLWFSCNRESSRRTQNSLEIMVRFFVWKGSKGKDRGEVARVWRGQEVVRGFV